MASIKSQLTGKTVSAPKTINPQSQFGQFVFGDMKGGSAAHEFRMTMVSGAIREALKGNSRALLEARDIATGKSKKALSYFDGFAAVGIPARIAYTGKLTDPANKAVVEQIDATTAALASDFELAFLARFHAPAEPKAKKAKDADASTDAASADASADASASEALAVTVADLDVPSVMSAAAAALSTGAALPEEAELIRQALAAYDAARTLAALEAKPELLAA